MGRSEGWLVTGTLRAATAVKLSRPNEVVAISRAADAMVAMLMVGGVELLRDVSAMCRSRVLAFLIEYDDDGLCRFFRDMLWTGLLLLVARAMTVVSLIAIVGSRPGDNIVDLRDLSHNSPRSEANAQLLIV